MLANFRTEELVWDKASSYIYESYRASTSDERGRRLLVRIVNGGHEEDLRDYELSLAWEHENNGNSGLDAFKQVDGKEGTYELYYTTGMLSNFGKLEANLYLTNGQESITSEPFIVDVFKGINMESVESSDSFSTLTGYIARLRGLEGNFNQWEDAENGRVASENERVIKEDERSVEYTKRVNQESERVNEESIRVQSEQERRVAEADREASEGNRETAEEGRVLSEQERIDNENARNNTEADVIESESLRKEAELGRVNAEDGRVASENLREQEYSTRLANEDERVLAEQGREVAEADREASEGSRITAEQGRESAEADRVASEGSRVTAEQGRELAEQGREGRLAGLEHEVRGVIQEKIDEKYDEEIAKVPEFIDNPEDFVYFDRKLQDVDSFVEMVFDELYEIVVEKNLSRADVTISLRSKKQDSAEEDLMYRGGILADYLGYAQGVRISGDMKVDASGMFKNTIINDLPKFDGNQTPFIIDTMEGMFEGATLHKSVSISDLGVSSLIGKFIEGMFRGVNIPSANTTLDLRGMSLNGAQNASEMFKDADVKGDVILPPLESLKYVSTNTTGIFDGAEVNFKTSVQDDLEWIQGRAYADGNNGVSVELID